MIDWIIQLEILMRKPNLITEMAPPAAPDAALRRALQAAIAENDAGLLRAESSQAPFNSTRLLLRGRRDVLDAVVAYLDGDSSRLDALAGP